MKFKVGDKIKIPTTKSISIPLEEASAIKTAKALKQDHLFINRIESLSKNSYTVGVTIGRQQSDFHEDDLELYEEPKEESIVYTKKYLKENKIIVEVKTNEEKDILCELGVADNSSFIVPGGIRLDSGGQTHAGINWYKEEEKYRDYKIVQAQEVINSHKQENKEMKAQIFAIKGKPALLDAILEDLTGIENGYKLSPYCDVPYKKEVISNNRPNFSSKEEFTDLFFGSVGALISGKVYKTFHLPKDYEAALDFAKEQLDDKNFIHEYKLGDIVTIVKNISFGHQKGVTGKITDGKKLKSLGVTSKDGIEWYHYSSEIRPATKSEIDEFHKSNTVDLILGSRSTTVKVEKNKVTVRGATETIDNIKKLLYKYKTIAGGVRVGDWGVWTVEDVRFIRIGCESENNLISLKDLETIIDTASKL